MSCLLEITLESYFKSLKGPLAVAVSGGGDSLGLCLLLKNLNIPFVGLHFNHNLRLEAAKECQWLGQLFKSWNIPFYDALWQNPPSTKGRLQAEARQARYTFFEEKCHSLGVKNLLVAHTADDVAETLLMRLFYGSGPQGLQGMASKKEFDGIELHRPFLQTPRKEVRTYLKACGQPWLEDPSNYNAKFVRVRARHWLSATPQLKEDVLALGAAFKDLENALKEHLKPLQIELKEEGGGVSFPYKILMEPLFARQRFFQKILKTLPSGYKPVRPQKIERLIEHLKTSDKPYTLGALTWQSLGESVVVSVT